MTMTQNLSFKNKQYPNITYVIYSDEFIPVAGYLKYAILNPKTAISSVIQVKEPLLNDYKNAFITLAYKQVKGKWARRNNQASNFILFRQDLTKQILEESKRDTFEYDATKILLLNGPTDDNIPDTGLQCVFRFEKHDGTNEFQLPPGSAMRSLLSLVGLGFIDIDDIDLVFNNIILDMSEFAMKYIIPNSGISPTSNLQEDIITYLHFAFYGN